MSHILIPINSIQEYFNKKAHNIKPFSLKATENDYIGYRDKEGVLVLPANWDD